MTQSNSFYYDLVRYLSALPVQILLVGFNKLDSEEFWNVESEAEFETVKAKKIADIDHWISDLLIVRKIVYGFKYSDRYYGFVMNNAIREGEEE